MHTSFPNREVNYTQIAQDFEKEFEQTLSDITTDIQSGQTELSSIFSIDADEIELTKKNIDDAVQSFITHSKTFEMLDAQIQDKSALAPIFVAKIMATGDAALLKDIPQSILEYGKQFLSEWADEQKEYSPPQQPIFPKAPAPPQH